MFADSGESAAFCEVSPGKDCWTVLALVEVRMAYYRV
ncbi:hypothetical protein RSal33209_2058 [Renibacterium salmoninarum ATCC 33209]|uniref:Uncharacterized protein n=1 Tax=Renibacterium salmoninarum (strain ATCC 33209 / DSM 20767 / JCM 11484 / NBRC 15589 / NCIMB 2235) TaxID=288705 RepID=A9WSK2_RENSM|nr:hypothetical protein RSal33209_2058 [Renibacterium salmoninarum ATCC 33209]